MPAHRRVLVVVQTRPPEQPVVHRKAERLDEVQGRAGNNFNSLISEHGEWLKSGKITVIDGPFAESKEIVGGYAIMDAKSREEALAHTAAIDIAEVHARRLWHASQIDDETARLADNRGVWYDLGSRVTAPHRA